MADQTSNDKAIVGVVVGSKTDLSTIELACNTLKDFGIKYELKVLSAHRTPEETVSWAKGAEGKGIKVIIAAAGMAAHLAGVVASYTSLPVIGVPLKNGSLNGLDSLLSTVQMPKGTPVATVAIGEAGAVNAALLAVRVLALSDHSLRDQLQQFKDKQKIQSS